MLYTIQKVKFLKHKLLYLKNYLKITLNLQILNPYKNIN